MLIVVIALLIATYETGAQGNLVICVLLRPHVLVAVCLREICWVVQAHVRVLLAHWRYVEIAGVRFATFAKVLAVIDALQRLVGVQV